MFIFAVLDGSNKGKVVQLVRNYLFVGFHCFKHFLQVSTKIKWRELFATITISYPECSEFLDRVFRSNQLLTKKPEDSGYEIAMIINNKIIIIR